jgi:signal transduction histidine kinase
VRAPARRFLWLTLVIVAGAVLVAYLIMASAARGFFDELTQSSNRSLAMYIAAEAPLMARGKLNRDQLAQIAHQAMVVNPVAEVYVLDQHGAILGSGVTQPLTISAIDTKPLRQFLTGAALPIYGDNPRQPDEPQVFSAAEIRSANRLDGYVYVLLSAASRDTLAATIAGSHILRFAANTFVVLALIAALFAWLIGRHIAKPLDSLHARVLELAGETGSVESWARADIDAVRSAVESLAARLQSQLQRAEHADRQRRELFASVSHDLRTPLTAMRGSLETLTTSARPLSIEAQRRLLAIALRHSDRLGRLVEQIFALSRLDVGSVSFRPEHVVLAELAQDIVAKLQGIAESKRVQLALEVDPDAPNVYADIGMLETILQNLLDNALRHTPSGGMVKLVVAHVGLDVETSVTDTGEGIAGDLLQRLGEPFTAGAGGRSGLGLAIVRRALALHGSSLQIANLPQRGTKASFRLAAVARDAKAIALSGISREESVMS